MRRLIFLSLALAGCSKPPVQTAFQMPPVPVHTAIAQKKDLRLHFEAMGTISASQTAQVKAQSAGTIAGVHFTEGQSVQEGDLLFTIDDAPYVNRVQEVEAQLMESMAHLRNAKRKLARYKSLSQQDLIAQVEWDELETQILLHEAHIKASKARLAAAKLDVEHCQITAPISGKTGKTAYHKGSITGAEPLVVISQIEPLYVDFAITEKELQQLSSNLSLEVYSAGSDALLAT